MCASRRESDERAPLLDQPLHTVPLVFFDLETTGLFPHRGDRVCEVALLRERGGEPERRFETLVNPQRPLSEQSFLVNGIRAEELAGAPLFAEAAGPLRAISEGAVLVAHNAPFDMEFLHTELARAGLPPILTIHGDADPTVPYQHGVRLQAALEKAGVPSQLLTIPGGKHGGFNRDETLKIFTTIQAFLKKHGIAK